MKNMKKEYFKTELSTLYNGDCVEVMKNMYNNNIKVDKVITSPPYNIIRPNSTDRGYDEYKDGMSNIDYINFTLEVFKGYDNILNKNGAILYNMSYGTENPNCMIETINAIVTQTEFTLADIITWKKSTATPNNVSHNKLTRICEFVYVFCRQSEYMTFKTNKEKVGVRETGQSTYENVYNFIDAKNNDEVTDLNKATFSSEFVQRLFNLYVGKTDIVFDNFSGTGTTMKVSEENNNKFYGIELSKAQCDFTIKRIKRGIQQNLF